jgi:hypothetical protein
MPIRPWRRVGGDLIERPPVPVPPEAMPGWRGGRPLKAWTYVGAFGPDLMLCAAHARIGPVPVSWWAVWDGHRLAEGRRGVAVAPQRVTVRGRLVLELDLGAAIEVVSPHGDQYVWTRKRLARVRGRFDGRSFELGAIVDESAGYHARHTAWRWSAGVGVAESGAAVAWNLVDGIHDADEASERTVWVDGVPHEVPPVAFAGDLSSVGGLRFSSEAVRARRENLLVVRSDYEQPFGTFSGELPVAGPLREGWGVMERHDVRW